MKIQWCQQKLINYLMETLYKKETNRAVVFSNKRPVGLRYKYPSNKHFLITIMYSNMKMDIGIWLCNTWIIYRNK